ncbi:unnamed protein product [Prunus armeniaca]|uniref:Uncharacterized protein n=1 Tax=Prunus armeniaca TaxID=36596 RepID=A0A6J5WV42_PRUAR|nr:unnamed protein product [Prunus armeniaca]
MAKLGHGDAVKTLLEVGASWNALSLSNLFVGDFVMDTDHEKAYNILLNWTVAGGSGWQAIGGGGGGGGWSAVVGLFRCSNRTKVTQSHTNRNHAVYPKSKPPPIRTRPVTGGIGIGWCVIGNRCRQ